jgi:glycosyltransferase involved in cell wall biosynthesis
MNYLIVDLNIKLDGHKVGFIQNLLYEVKNNANTYHFLINASDQFVLHPPANKNVVIHTLTPAEQTEIDQKKRFLDKSHAQWKCIEKYAKVLEINHLILMELDPYQVSIGLSRCSFTIAGIWFRPYHRMEKGEGSSLKFRTNKLQKALTMRWALLNRNLKKVFILNDETMPNLPKHNPPRFHYLPDPCFVYPQNPALDIRKHYGIEPENIILLQFGYIDERKNSENFILALNALPTQIAKRFTLLVIGKFKPHYEASLHQLKEKKASFQLITQDQFISDADMETTFAQSDLILRMNVNFFGSSGVVGIAALHNKPCLVSDFGVMAEQVAKYKLGHALNPYNVEGLSHYFIDYAENKSQTEISGEAYRLSHSATAYANTLLNI